MGIVHFRGKLVRAPWEQSPDSKSGKGHVRQDRERGFALQPGQDTEHKVQLILQEGSDSNVGGKIFLMGF